ncbi:hypothetical protein Tco_0248054 [Tanacetum coccineum]
MSRLWMWPSMCGFVAFSGPMVLERIKYLFKPFTGRTRALEQETWDLDVENKQKKKLKDSYDLIINPEEDDIELKVVLGRSFLRLTKGITNFENGIITIYYDLDPFNDDSDKSNDSGDDWDAIIEGIDFGDIPEIDELELPPFVCNMRKSSKNKKKPCKNYKMKYDDEGPSLTINRALTREELLREELEKDLWEIIVILNEPRPIIETLKYGDRYKKILDTILLDKLKLDGKLELEEVEVNAEMVREYKAIKEKIDPDAFVLPIWLEGRFDTHTLADTGSNINIIPYHIFEKLGKE